MTNVWCIGGSDNTGGAGIQKDLATINSLGSTACSVISCVTSQNHLGIQHIEAVSEEAFASQLKSLLAVGVPEAIKIGMLANSMQAELLTRYLVQIRRLHPDVVVICDPVCAASAGGETPDIQLQNLLPLLGNCDLVTPNIPEAEVLAAQTVKLAGSAKSLGKKLLARLNQDTTVTTRLLLKGGHMQHESQSIDIFFDTKQTTSLHSPRVNTSWTHGTGCTLASAVAATVVQQFPLEDAVVIAKAFVQQSLNNSRPLARNNANISFGTTTPSGWPVHTDIMPSTESDLFGPFPPLNAKDFHFYVVVDSSHWIERLLNVGITTLQLRIKKPVDKVKLEQEIIAAIALGKKYNAQVFINDYWQLAIKHGAYGVHLGQDDMAVANLVAIQAAGLRLGISTHGYMELVKAAAIRPSYIALGHIFATQTKSMPSQPQGLKRLALYQQWASCIAPTVAIGGIKLHNLNDVLNTGVDSIAVVTAVTEAQNPEATAREFHEKIHAYFD